VAGGSATGAARLALYAFTDARLLAERNSQGRREVDATANAQIRPLAV
jgi:hypothetical protein